MLGAVCEKIVSRGWFLILTAINVVVYYGHYADTLSFPFDFSLTYYGFAAFWISAMQHGLFPEWIPFQAYGYPLPINPQAYLFYLPHWLFVVTGLAYTGYVHTVLQCLHVLFGSIGLWLLIYRMTHDRQLALVGAIIFQFFGGFFSNSEHPDIIRGFAFCPWLIWSLHVESTQRALALRNWLLPFIVLLISTGAYPGHIIASYLVVGGYLGIASIHRFLVARRTCEASSWTVIFKMGLLFCLGILLAIPHLYPGFLYGHLTTRGMTAAHVVKWGWDLRLLPLLIFTWDRAGLPYDTVMTSLYIGLPAFCALFFMPSVIERDLKPWIVVFFLLLTMITGEQSIFYRALGTLFSPLVYSRFPGTDYRGFVAVFLIVAAVFGIRQLCTMPSFSFLRKRGLIAATVLFVIFGGITGTSIRSSELMHSLSIISCMTLLIAARNILKLSKSIFLIALILLVVWDSREVIWSVPQHWMSPTLDQTYRQQFGLVTTPPLPVARQFLAPLPQRPNRSEEAKTLAWIGYLDGSFHTEDYTGLILQSRVKIESSPQAKTFMKDAWRPVVLPSHNSCATESSFADVVGEPDPQPSSSRIGQIYYGIDRIGYKTEGLDPFSFVENESYFPGWVMKLVGRDGVSRTLSARDCFGLRRWDIPSGGPYRAEASFEFPYLRGTVLVAVCFGVLYLVLLVSVLMRRINHR